MNTVCRELTDAELDVVSGGSWLEDLAAVATIGVIGVAVVAATAHVVKQTN